MWTAFIIQFYYSSITCDFGKYVNNHFTSESNYFIICTTAVSPHLLQLSFHLMNEKTGTYFKEWHWMHYDVVYEFFVKFLFIYYYVF